MINFVLLTFRSTNIRGILLTSTGIVGITGTLIVYAVVPSVSYVATGYIALAVSIAHVVGLFFVPESPVYYAMKGKIQFTFFFKKLCLHLCYATTGQVHERRRKLSDVFIHNFDNYWLYRPRIEIL